MPLSGTVHHLSGPDMFALSRSAVCVWVCGVCWCVVGVFSCVCWCASLCVVVCLWLWCVAQHTLKITAYICILMYMHFARFLMKKTQSRTLTVHDVCFSKPLTFHNGFMSFASRSCFKHFLDFRKRSVAWSPESAWNSYEKQMTWNHCGRSKASKSRHHGK